MIDFLDLYDVIFINAKILGGTARLRNWGVLESAVARPMASAFGADGYPTVCDKAAALLHSLVLNHAFVDANKRTATIATIAFLERNGLNVVWQPQDALDFIIDIAQGKCSVEQISQWLSQNTETIL